MDASTDNMAFPCPEGGIICTDLKYAKRFFALTFLYISRTYSMNMAANAEDAKEGKVVGEGLVASESELEKRVLEMYLDEPAAGEIKASFANIKVEPKKEEAEEANFPRNLHNACELFVMCNLHENALRCSTCINTYMAFLSTNPDGTSKHKMGRACVCWGCGHVGLPKNPQDKLPLEGVEGPLPECGNCGSKDETNWVRPLDAKKNTLPWMQADTKGAVVDPEKLEQAKAALDVKKNEELAKLVAELEKAKNSKFEDKKGSDESISKDGKKTKPNDPCPCGNGKKFKKCGCGAR